jgi:hypothetical protein
MTHLFLVFTLCKKFTRARTGLRESQEVFSGMTKTTDPRNVAEWTRQADKAEHSRLRNVEAMDVYNVKTQTRKHSGASELHCISSLSFPAPGRAVLEAGLIEEEQKTSQFKGVTSWLATGLKIEEAQ